MRKSKMIELLTTEKIPEWAIGYFWNGDMGELSEEEEKAMLEWEDEMIEFAKEQHPRKQFAGLHYEFADGDDAEPYFTRRPAFGERNEYALPHRGEPSLKACDVYDVNIYASYN